MQRRTRFVFIVAWACVLGGALPAAWAAPSQRAAGAEAIDVRFLSLSPSNPTLLKGSFRGFRLLLVLKNRPVDVTSLVTKWASSNPSVASVDKSGHVSALQTGIGRITAFIGPLEAGTSVTVDEVASVQFGVQPSSTSVGAVIDPGVAVAVLDNEGKPVAGLPVTLSLGDRPNPATLQGTLMSTTAASGIASFSDLRLDWLGNGYTLLAMVATPSGPVVANSAPFDETRVGDPCLGPDTPACSSGCADTDLDGLNDAWERAGGVDLNGDGVITDAAHDLLLPGADPRVPDVYLKYDYMMAADHDHQPPARAWDQMRAMFAAHGIVLHVLAPAGGISEHQVTTLDPEAQPSCAGTDFITMRQLRAGYLGNLKPAYHYMVFAHDSTTPSDGTLVGNCSIDTLCRALPAPAATGVGDVLGDDAIVSFGAYVDAHTQIGIELWTATMMHELGHNFGLVHGSLADPGNVHQECLIKKPNYISVMNYSYQTAGIIPARAPGEVTAVSCATDSDCGPPIVSTGRCATPNTCFCTDDGGAGNNVCYRPDYAEDNLLNLNETTLNENVGVGGPSTLEDIVWYWNVGGILPGPSNGGPIDWNNDGATENLTGCIQAVPPTLPNCPDVDDNGTNTDPMETTADWTQVDGRFVHLDFQFQCSQGYRNDRP